MYLALTIPALVLMVWTSGAPVSNSNEGMGGTAFPLSIGKNCQ